MNAYIANCMCTRTYLYVYTLKTLVITFFSVKPIQFF